MFQALQRVVTRHKQHGEADWLKNSVNEVIDYADRNGIKGLDGGIETNLNQLSVHMTKLSKLGILANWGSYRLADVVIPLGYTYDEMKEIGSKHVSVASFVEQMTKPYESQRLSKASLRRYISKLYIELETTQPVSTNSPNAMDLLQTLFDLVKKQSSIPNVGS